ncbi:tRNA uridine-5-carboxymethylaminomethyl(34) synthesis GTPase MnmE [Candidatus Neomarinimicrobiota bacterium]
MINDTIVAPATPFGTGGISVIRISGPESLSFILKYINLPDGSPLELKHRMATLVNLSDTDSNIFDQAVITYYQNPHSYTGEELVEISCHGSPVIVQKILNIASSAGLRLADPGEFTRRAFLNGKIDLLQAEAVANTINSLSIEGSKLNFQILSGVLSEKLFAIKSSLISALSKVEFELDISEESLQPELKSQLEDLLFPVQEMTSNLLSSYHYGNLLTKGALVVIAGPPNVGKSTLLNSLSNSDRAITHDIPGTTRDPIDVSFFIDGIPITLVDTAGLRSTVEEIELKGIARTKSYLEKADLVIVLDSVEQPENYPDYSNLKCPLIFVTNKSDLLNKNQQTGNIKNQIDKIYISALNSTGLHTLQDRIKEALLVNEVLSSSVALTTGRQNSAIQTCHSRIEAASKLLHEITPQYELIAFELQESLNSLDALIGKTTPDDILNNVFNKFCVGK